MVLRFIIYKTYGRSINVSVITRELEDEEEQPDPNSIDKKQIPEGVEVFERTFLGAQRNSEIKCL
jgi:hypothetical protein